MKLTGSPVGETVADAVAGKLPRAGSGENKVTLDTGVDNLYDDLLVGEADDQAVLGGVAAKCNVSNNIFSLHKTTAHTTCSSPG